MGKLLGEVDGALMTQLFGMGVVSPVTMYDQAMRKLPDHHHITAQALISPFSVYLIVVRWLLHTFLQLLLQWSAWGVLAWQRVGDTQAQEAGPVAPL